MKTEIKLSPRNRVKLTDADREMLEAYLKEQEGSAYNTIRMNTGISRATILDTLSRGWMELRPYLKLRDFLIAIQTVKV